MPRVGGQRLQRLLLGAAADQQQLELRQTRQQQRRGLDQQVEALVGVERAGEADHRRAVEAKSLAQRRVGLGARPEFVGVDRIGNDRDPVGGDAAGGDLVAQSLADRRDVVGAAQRKTLQRPRRAVAQAALARPAVVDGGILPEGADFVDDRDADAAARPAASAARSAPANAHAGRPGETTRRAPITRRAVAAISCRYDCAGHAGDEIAPR